jgi:hypothetical protein
MEYRSHQVRVENLPAQRPVVTVAPRPRVMIGLLAASAAVLVLSQVQWFLAAPLAVMAVYLRFRPQMPTFQGYPGYFVVYRREDPEHCDLYYLSEIAGWEFRNYKDGPRLLLYLQDGQRICVSQGVDLSTYRYLSRVMPRREIRTSQRH